MIEQLTIMVLLAILVIVVFGIIWLRDLFAAVILLGLYSLTAAAIFVVMDAVDVAFTEAAVGAGISTILLFGAISLTDHKQSPQAHKNWVAVLTVVLTGGLLIYGSLDLAAYGSLTSPAYTHAELARHFIEKSGSETGVPNIVTSVLASYRGYDTLGETVVVFTAAVAVWSLIGLRHAGKSSLQKNAEGTLQAEGSSQSKGSSQKAAEGTLQKTAEGSLLANGSSQNAAIGSSKKEGVSADGGAA